MSAALLLFQLYLEHCFDDGVCVSCTCSACWRRYLCVVLISEKVYVAWDVCVAIALCGHWQYWTCPKIMPVYHKHKAQRSGCKV